MNYLKFIGGMALALGILPGYAAAQDSAYTLQGNIRGLDTGWVFLYHPGDGPVDSTTISRGRFHFAGAVKEPEFCHLIFRKRNRDQIYSMGFFLQGGVLEVTGERDSLSSVVFSGAPIQEEYLAFQHGLLSVKEENFQQRMQLVREYAIAHPASYVAILEVLDYFVIEPNADTLQKFYNGFTPEIQASRSGRQLKEALDITLLTGVGRPAPVFTQTDIKGKPVSLSSFRGQYVLVDFWASWCGPCRAENPNVLKSYRAYHSKGFTVLGVSLDNEKAPWIGAVRKDGLPWTQVSDLKGWQNSAAVMYGIYGIPMNYLLDKDGIIVAKSLRGDDLEKKLAELLH